MFSVSNHQSKDCGAPPELPVDFDKGNYWRSYFENHYGEQWLCWYDRDKKELFIHSGDCHWRHRLKPIRLTIDTYLAEMRQRMKTEKSANLVGQTGLAGVALAPTVILRDPTGLFTMLIDDEGDLVTCNVEERAWVDACIAGSRVEVPETTLAEWREIRDRFWRRMHQERNKDSDSEKS